VIKKGDTIAKIALAVYGVADATGEKAIRHANPILISFPAGASLSFFAGDTLKIPAYTPPIKPTSTPVRRIS
jgi:hypothetical protein